MAYTTVHNTRTDDPREASNKSLGHHATRIADPDAHAELERRVRNGSKYAGKYLARADIARATREARAEIEARQGCRYGVAFCDGTCR